MNSGIAKVCSDGTPAVRGVDTLKVLRHLIKCFVPAEPLPTVRSTAHWILQTVVIVVKISQRGGLRADVPAAERILFVTADV